jgi:virginiamycin B lyase
VRRSSLIALIVATVGLSSAPAAFALKVQEFTYPGAKSVSGLTRGPDGAIWFTDMQAHRVGRITASGKTQEFGGGGLVMGPQGITAGADGNLWFGDLGSRSIGRITPSGEITEYPRVGVRRKPFAMSLATSADGNVWFTDWINGKIGRVTPAGQITEFTGPTGIVSGIAKGPGGALWLCNPQSRTTGNVFRVSASGALTKVLGGRHAGFGPTAGPDGSLWMSETFARRITRVSATGATKSISTRLPPTSITTDGNVLWFTEVVLDRQNHAVGHVRIGRATEAGRVTEFRTKVTGLPTDLTTDAHGNLWFTAGRHIVRVSALRGR